MESRLIAFKRTARLLDAERHVVVAMTGLPPPMYDDRMLAGTVAAPLVAVLGVDIRLVVAMPNREGEGLCAGIGGARPGLCYQCQGPLGAGTGGRGDGTVWLNGGTVWAAGAAEVTDAQLISETLSLATRSVWVASPGKV